MLRRHISRSMARRYDGVCVRHGGFLVHTGVARVPEVLAALRQCCAVQAPTCLFADLSDKLMQAHVDGHPEARPRYRFGTSYMLADMISAAPTSRS